MSDTNAEPRPQVYLSYSPHCPSVVGEGWACMIDDTEPAVGHAIVTGGPHDGRMLAVVCRRHATEAGHEEVKARLKVWWLAGLLAADLGPGPDGAPEVLHGDHYDAMPEHRHARNWPDEPPG